MNYDLMLWFSLKRVESDAKHMRIAANKTLNNLSVVLIISIKYLL